MANVNQDLYDNSVRHAADLRIHEEELRVQINRRTRRLEERLIKLYAKEGRSAKFVKELKRANADMQNFMKNALDDIRLAEIDFHTNSLQRTIGTVYKVRRPKSRTFLDRITGPAIRKQKSLAANLDAINQSTAIDLDAFIKANPDITAGQANKKIKELVNLNEQRSRTLTTTAITQGQSEAFEKVMNENSEAIRGYRFTAVLDSKTSEICAHHDGKVYDLDDTQYQPPLHWNCRSILVPEVISYDEMKESDSKRWKRNILRAIADTARIMYFNGAGAKNETYSRWLRRQSWDVQYRHLGFDEDRVALFQGGELDLEKFTTAKGKFIPIEKVRQLDNVPIIHDPIAQKRIATSAWDNFEVNALYADDFIRQPSLRDDLKNFYITDANNSLADLSVVDYRHTKGNQLRSARDYITSKRGTRIRANDYDPENYYFDPVSGEKYNPLIYRANNNVLASRLAKVDNSNILTKEQKIFIKEFQDEIKNEVSTNKRSVIIENLRLAFERQNKDGQAWTNFVRYSRSEMKFAVTNVSKLLETDVRRHGSTFMKFKGKEGPASAVIFDKTYTFDDIAANVNKNQRYVDDWVDKQGLAVASKLYLRGKAPIKSYFLPPSQSNPFDFKKRIIKYYEKFLETVNIPKRMKKAYQATIGKWLRNPLEVADDELIELGHEIRATFFQYLPSEILARKTSIKVRKAIVDGTPQTQNKAIRTLAAAMEEVASGRTKDYDALAVSIGKRINDEFQIDFPWAKASTKDHHKSGSRMLKQLEDSGVIKVGMAVKERKAVIDLDTNKPSATGWKETMMREVEIIDPELANLQAVHRQLYIGRRIGIVEEKNRLHLRHKDGKRTLFYEDAAGRKTSEKAITKTASSKFSGDDDVLAKHLDRDFLRQVNYANKQEWALNAEFSEFFEDIANYRPRADRKGPRLANAYREMIDKRGEMGYAFLQALKWHRQNGTKWTNIHQWDGRGRFYEQGYLSATRGETVRPFLEAPKAGKMDIFELQAQLGAHLGTGTEALTFRGRLEVFAREADSILELGHIVQRRKKQFNQNIEDFLAHPIIGHHDAEAIPVISRYALEAKRVEDYLNARGYTFSKSFVPIDQLKNKKARKKLKNFLELDEAAQQKVMDDYRTTLMVENDASSSGAQIIGLSARDLQVSDISNVTPTTQKQRLYDIIAQETVTDPEFQKIADLIGEEIQWEDLMKAAKAQNMVNCCHV